MFKNKTYSIINISGLAVSLSAAMLILLWVWDELSYDRMHNEGDRIYSMTASFDPDAGEVWHLAPSAITYAGKNEIPAIEAAARVSIIFGDQGSQLVEYEGKRFLEDIRYVDAEFFRLFDFPFVAGNREQPFANLHSVVLAQSVAQKYFGDADPIGRLIQVSKTESFQVSGVMEDMPGNSSLDYGVMLPFELLGEKNQRNLNNDWWDFRFETFLLLKPGANPDEVARQLTKIHVDNSGMPDSFQYGLFPLFDLHLKGGNQRGEQVWIFVIVAVVILLIACINYVNLVTARSSRRSKEIGIRKVVGASQVQLFWQFLSESVVVFAIALTIAIGLSYVAMPVYNSLSGKDMVFSLLDGRIWLLFGTTLLAVLAMAGVYPALALSLFKPASALKGTLPSVGKSGGFRKALVIVQFTCSVILIVSTIVIGKQLAHIRQLDLGYDKENVLTFRRHNFENLDAIKAELGNQPGILAVSASSERLDNAWSMTDNIGWEGKPADMANYIIGQLSVDRDFLKAMDIALLAGTGFTGTPADSNNYILNETAAKQIGADVGTPITYNEELGTVVGIVKDFHFRDMKTAIGPLILFMNPKRNWDHIYVRTTGKDAGLAVAAVEKLWTHYNADYEFNYTFMDGTFDQLYREDIRTGQLFNIFAGIAILLSCLGLFGLVTYTAEAKVKEIGIRKTLGASVGNIIVLVSKDFLKLVGISFLVGFPLGWWMMNKWLDNYVYRTGVEWWVFVVAGFVAFAIAAIAVCGKSWRAAQENPIGAIRTE